MTRVEILNDDPWGDLLSWGNQLAENATREARGDVYQLLIGNLQSCGLGCL